MVLTHVLSPLWDSEPVVNKVVIFLDYAGILDTISAGILLVIWKRKPKKSHERKLALWTILLSFFAGVFWVADSKFNHRLTALQAQSSELVLSGASNQLSKIEAKYAAATNAQAIAEQAAEHAMAAASDASISAKKLKKRSFSEEQKQSAKLILSKYSGTRIGISSTMDDADSGVLAAKLEDFLGSCGWVVPGGRVSAMFTQEPQEVEIQVMRESDVPAARALGDFLDGCGIAEKKFRPRIWTNSDISITIGPQ
jgi:hypothetical protein